MSLRAVVAGCGHSVPKKIVTNHELEQLVDTTDEWIVQRTGIRQRHICGEGESTTSLAIEASKEALLAAGWEGSSIDMVIVSTVCQESTFPATACFVQDAIGAKSAGAFDMGAACAGFIYGTSVADGLIQSHQAKRVLVVGVDTLSKVVDWTDRSTCVLFGDGAAAVLFEAHAFDDRGVIKTITLADGSGAGHISIESGGTHYPAGVALPEGVNPFIQMNGNETYRFAVKAMGDACCRVLEEAEIHSDDVDLFVPHQANKRIIDASAERMGLESSRVFVNVDQYGNTSAASIPLALYEAEKTGRMKRGDLVLTVGFGAGLVWGASLIRW